MSGLAVAMIGQRDLPATYGGVERHVEEIGARLQARGHEVTVFTRRSADAGPTTHRGMRLVPLPAIRSKHLDTISHSLASALVATRRPFDIVHYHALGPGLAAPWTRALSPAGVVQTVHGLDDQRAKWNPVARGVLGLAQWMSARVPDATLVDASWLAEHYRERFGRETTVALNGSTPVRRPPRETIAGLVGDQAPYILFVGRFVPEKCVDLLVQAWRQVPGSTRLVLVGGSAYTDAYADQVRRLARLDPRVVLAGNRFGEEYSALLAHASAFVLASAVEGLPLTLLDAAAHALPVVASDIPAHREVLVQDGPGHRLVPVGDAEALAAALTATMADLASARRGAAATREAVLARHDWERTTDVVEQVYERVLELQQVP